MSPPQSAGVADPGDIGNVLCPTSAANDATGDDGSFGPNAPPAATSELASAAAAAAGEQLFDIVVRHAGVEGTAAKTPTPPPCAEARPPATGERAAADAA